MSALGIYDVKTTHEDTSQRILNALLYGVKVLIHRHEGGQDDSLSFGQIECRVL